MKIPTILPSALCVAAGVLLTLDTVRIYWHGEKFDVFFFAVGIYFIGKGLFIQSLLGMVSEFKNNR